MGHINRAFHHLESIDDDCEGFDQFDDLMVSLDASLCYIHHTIYVASRELEGEDDSEFTGWDRINFENVVGRKES